MSDEAILGLGTNANFLKTSLFGAIFAIAAPPAHRQHDPVFAPVPHAAQAAVELDHSGFDEEDMEFDEDETGAQSRPRRKKWKLTDLVPSPGYFIAGATSGIASRTTTAPLDRLKVYLIAQTGVAQEAVEAAKSGKAVLATKHSANTLFRACQELWAAGGIRSLFAGESGYTGWTE